MTNPTPSRNDFPLAVILKHAVENDPAFHENSLKEITSALEKTYHVAIREMSNNKVGQTLEELSSLHQKKISLILFRGHGNQKFIQFKPQTKDGNYTDAEDHQFHFKSVEKTAKVFFESCLVAPLAQKISQQTGLTAYASDQEIYDAATFVCYDKKGDVHLLLYDWKGNLLTKKIDSHYQQMPLSEEEAFELVKAYAEQNQPQALAILGIHYLNGRFVEKNLEKARGYFFESLLRENRCSGLLLETISDQKGALEIAQNLFEIGLKKKDSELIRDACLFVSKYPPKDNTLIELFASQTDGSIAFEESPFFVNNSFYACYLGLIYLKKNNSSLAFSFFKRAYELGYELTIPALRELANKTNNPQILYQLAQFYVQYQRPSNIVLGIELYAKSALLGYEEAIKELHQIWIGNEHADENSKQLAAYHLGQIHLEKGEFFEAYFYFEKGIKFTSKTLQKEEKDKIQKQAEELTIRTMEKSRQGDVKAALQIAVWAELEGRLDVALDGLWMLLMLPNDHPDKPKNIQDRFSDVLYKLNKTRSAQPPEAIKVLRHYNEAYATFLESLKENIWRPEANYFRQMNQQLNN